MLFGPSEWQYMSASFGIYLQVLSGGILLLFCSILNSILFIPIVDVPCSDLFYHVLSFCI